MTVRPFWRRTGWRCVLSLAVACGPNQAPLTVNIALSAGPGQACPSQACEAVAAACAPVVQVRIVDPNDSTRAYVSECSPLPATGNVCGIGEVLLPTAAAVPTERVEVQVAVWAKPDVIQPDGSYFCPTTVPYGVADNFAVNASPMPALAGRTFIEPNQNEATVTLGCGDLPALNRTTCDEREVRVEARVIDADTAIYVDGLVADRLSVSFGDPRESDDGWVLDSARLTDLTRVTAVPIPTWTGIYIGVPTSACVAIRDDLPASTTLVTCENVAALSSLRATWLSRETLTRILSAVNEPRFPDGGLLIGVVVDALGQPAANVQAAALGATVTYPDATLSGTTGTVTSQAGLFVSSDAEFNSEWTLTSQNGSTVRARGGLIVGKATILFVRLPIGI